MQDLRRSFCACFLILLVLGAGAGSAFAQANVTGQWTGVQTWPYRPVHQHLLPNGKVLFWSYYNESLTPQVWDPNSNAITPAANIGYAIFCGGHSFLADGSLLVTGGHVADYVGYNKVSRYNPFTNSWTSLPAMNTGRWYPTNTTLANGDVLVLSGDINSNTNVDTLPQVFQTSTNTWRSLTSALLALGLYPRAFLAPNGKVFDAGPDRQSRYLNTSGTGAWSSVALQNFGAWRDYGTAVMYDVGKVLAVGGGDPPTASAEIIDLNSATPVWKFTGSMSVARRQLNGTVLPDGTVLITGGSSGSGFDNSATPTLSSEIWDPATGKFTVVASQSVYRGYHSTALLLPDGRVVSGGGNVGGPNVQIYSPPYLFKGTRPTITSAPGAIGYGGNFVVSTPTPSAITGVSLIRAGSVTHSFNMDQRFMHLPFTVNSTGVTVTGPANANIAPPGYYMLFLLANGVPSVAAMVQVSPTAATAGGITGLVTDTANTPLQGATVSYSNGSTTTDATGHYTLNNVAAGSVTLTASLAGYQSNTAVVSVTSGAVATAPTIQLTAVPTGTVTGQVTSNGAALAGVTVAYSGGSTTTDVNGNFTLLNVPAGAVAITASKSGFVDSTQTVNVTANATTTVAFALSPAPTGTISGKVTNTSGAAVSGATVSYGGGNVATDVNGNYTLANVPAGTVLVQVTASGYQAAQQNVTVTANTTSTANFTLTPVVTTGKVTGKVTNVSNGQLLVGATVKYSGGSALTNSSGVYTLTNVPAGTVSLTASANGYLARTQTASVTGGGTTTSNFQLATAGKIAGKVTFANGTAAANAKVTVKGGVIATTVSLVTNSTGNYLTNWIPIGSYTVSVALTGHTTQTKSGTVTSGVTTTINFTNF